MATQGLNGASRYEITDTGGVNYECSVCGQRVEKTPEQASKFLRGGKLPESFDFLCGACWKQRADDEDAWERERTKNQRAGIGQAINLAHAHILHFGMPENTTITDEEHITREMKRLTPFYYELAQRIQRELGS